MNPKDFLKNKSFCPLPWNGFYVEPTGKVKNCVVSKDVIGDLKNNDIEDIILGDKNLSMQTAMIKDEKPKNCTVCYNLETEKNSFDIISSRIYYLKELRKTPLDAYDIGKFNLTHIDVRWRNTCNHACVYCDADFSSKWESELGIKITKPTDVQRQKLKNYIYQNIENLQNVYLAGGEPLLMVENEEFLTLLLEKNPNVTLRINTNLSKTNTKVFNLINRFKNVHWTVSVESMQEEFEYIRYGGNWNDFLDNLENINTKYHKISFNMLWFILNYKSMFSCVDFFMSKGFHPNSFIIGPILGPKYLDIRNLSDNILDQLKILLKDKIDLKYGYLLQNSYENLLKHLHVPFEKNIDQTFDLISIMDKRRNLDSTKIFKDLYQERQNYGKTV